MTKYTHQHNINSHTNNTNNNKSYEIKEEPSLLHDIKRTMGLEDYSDTNLLLYILIFVFGIQKLNDLISFITGLLALPQKVEESYNFITKKDLILLDRLDDLMNQLLGITGADRVAIGKIHNGTYDHTRAHLMKFSIIYEVVSNKVSSTKNDIQNIPIDYIKDEILLGSTREFQRIDKTELNSKGDQYLDKLGLQSKSYKLLGYKEQIYGIIELHWVITPTINYEDDRQTLNRFNTTVALLEDTLQTLILKTNWLHNSIKTVKRSPVKFYKFLLRLINK